ncbi:MAG: LacI family DNA-binding transcriptional regulator [Acidobacteriota bacterium]|nr:LacI family DNA-binding transcriptional regulator [Acidobacteriota bacterium]
MTDVARAAAVSHQTVSRVLNGHPNVRPATRERVLAAIEALGYRPNLAARALASGRSTQLGLVTLNTMLLGPVATLYAVEQAARIAGYSVSVTSVGSINRHTLHECVSRLLQQSVAGVIIIAPVDTRDSPLSALPADLPAVAVEADPDSAVPGVTVDQELGAYLATRHLLDLGHRAIAHISGPEDFIEAQQRVVGWRRALTEANLPSPDVLVGDWSAQSGYDAGRLLAGTPEVTAVFAANDNMALGLLRALSEQGRSVPRDISIVGFDDIAEAGFFTPPLTSIRQDFAEMGRRSVELLLRQVETAARSVEHITLAPELVLRDSTAPPP